jgi:hypothetical protein
MAETAAQRFNRDYENQPDGNDAGGRKDRELNHQTVERLSRIYVNAANGTTPADDHHVS